MFLLLFEKLLLALSSILKRLTVAFFLKKVIPAGPVPFSELRTCRTKVWPGPFSELRTCQGSEFGERNGPFSELRTWFGKVRPGPNSEPARVRSSEKGMGLSPNSEPRFGPVLSLNSEPAKLGWTRFLLRTPNPPNQG